MAEAGTEIWFYHLERSSLDQVLPGLLEKTRERGWRALVRADDRALLDHVDERLWTYREESFLAHGRADQPHAARQPILLSDRLELGNGARYIALADGLWRDEAEGFARAFLLFGDAELDGARACWRMLGGREDVERRFWKQDGGKWREGP